MENFLFSINFVFTMQFLRYLGTVLIINHVVNGNTIILKVKKQKNYAPVWEDLDSRPLPSWYDNAKIGIFIHWGLYSVPSFGNYSEWFWMNWKSNLTKQVDYMNKNYAPGFQYQDFSIDFTAELFKPKEWAQLFQKSGAKYVVLTSKHHEGFAMFPSKYAFNWNSVDIGPHRDIVDELSTAIRKNTDIKFGVYYSLYEWYNPLYLTDADSNYTTNLFPTYKMIPEMKDLIKTYKPDMFWVDGDWEATDEYFQSKEFLAWLYNDSPVRDSVVVNDRWGQGIPCHHGGVFNCEDKYNPGELQKHKWESTVTTDKYSWGYRREAKLTDYITIEKLVELLARAISCGGNFLINIGPTKEGLIPPITQERLLQLGEWLTYNGEAIYGSQPWIYQNETNVRVWYTFNNDAVYAISLDWPSNNVLSLKQVWDLFADETAVVTMLTSKELQWTLIQKNQSVNIKLPNKANIKVQWAWVLKIQN